MTELTSKRFHPLYLLAVVYVIAVYAFPFLWFALNPATGDNVQADGLTPAMILPLLLPAVMGLVNLGAVIVCWNRISRVQLLYCAAIIKYSLIPFFIAGGLCIALAWLLTFSPVVIMIFVGPMVVAVFSVLGYLSMLGSAPFAIGYLIRSRQEQVHHPLLLLAGGILQFFFTADTISLMVLALKEKRCVKPTIVLGALLMLGLMALGALVIYEIAAHA